jgi:hypothetical protein
MSHSKAEIPLSLTTEEATALTGLLLHPVSSDESQEALERIQHKLAEARPFNGPATPLTLSMVRLISEFMRKVEPCQTHAGSYGLYGELKRHLELVEAGYASAVPQCGENPLEDTIYG